MTELFWFGLIGLVAVVAAIFMLMSDNAVHSALFLIVTMGCIAFLFLVLNAPFLAMIQITVYTGAIMVLFLFVIMLLGAERLRDSEALPEGTSRFRGYTPLAAVLVGALLLIVGIALNQVNFGLQPGAGPQPELRIMNAAPDSGTVDIFANDQLIADDLEFGVASSYMALTAGDYTIRLEPENGQPISMNTTLEPGTTQTLVDYGDVSTVQMTLIPDDNSTLDVDRSGRLTFFNAGATSVQIVDPGSEFVATDTRIIINELNPGERSNPLVEPEGTVNWQVVDASDPATVLVNLDDYAIDRDTSGLVVVTRERIFEGSNSGTLLPVIIPLVVESAPAFGGPRAIGLELFTNYMLVFQLLAVLLLAAMVGAIVLTHRELKSVTRRTGGRRRVSRPLVNVIESQVGHDVTTSGEAVPELQEPVGK